MNFIKNILAAGVETALIAAITYGAHHLLPFLPWYTLAIVSGIVAFVMGTKVPSFWTGFAAGSLIWGYMTYGMDAANTSILASRMAKVIAPGEVPVIGTLRAVHLVYLTSVLGGLICGLGGMTGGLARGIFRKKDSKTIENQANLKGSASAIIS